MKRDTIILFASGVTMLFLLCYDIGEARVAYDIHWQLGVEGMPDAIYSKLHQALERRIIGFSCSFFLTILQGAIIYFTLKRKNEERAV
jgi:hypothetical protein